MLQAIRKNVAWQAIPLATLCAGTLFLLVNMAISAIVLQISPALMLRYMSSLVMGEGVLTGDTTIAIVFMGLLVHFVLSLIFTFIITIVVHRWGMTVGIVGGALLGACFYFINFYTMTVFFPWFFAVSGWTWFLSHVAFGAVAGGVYERLDHYDEPFGGVK